MESKDNSLMPRSESKHLGGIKDRVALNTIEAISFVRERGIPMSKSKLYKMVTKNDYPLPHRRAGPRLIFYANELESWCESQITNPISNNDNPILRVLDSANKKIKKSI